MTAEELWNKSKLSGEYEAFQFGDDPDTLGKLVKDGIKTATCSALIFYELENEALPKVGDYSVILDSSNNALCIIVNTKVYVEKYCRISKEHAYKEGEGDRSLSYWRKVHKEFFTSELKEINKEFIEDLDLVVEEFKVVFKA